MDVMSAVPAAGPAIPAQAGPGAAVAAPPVGDPQAAPPAPFAEALLRAGQPVASDLPAAPPPATAAGEAPAGDPPLAAEPAAPSPPPRRPGSAPRPRLEMTGLVETSSLPAEAIPAPPVPAAKAEPVRARTSTPDVPPDPESKAGEAPPPDPVPQIAAPPPPHGLPTAPRTLDDPDMADRDAPAPAIAAAAATPHEAEPGPRHAPPAPADPTAAASEPAPGRAAPIAPMLQAPAAPAAVENSAAGKPMSAAPRVALDDDFASRIGLAIAHRVGRGGDELVVRMEPVELGRIHVRLSFDEQGSLRAVLAAESPAVVEALRRDTGELARALGDAGVRTDAQSFRFDRGAGGGGGDHGHAAWARWQGQQGAAAARHPFDPEQDATLSYRPVRRSGRLDLMA